METRTEEVILAVDMSASQVGLCAAPLNWKLDAEQVFGKSVGPLRRADWSRQHVLRLREFACAAREWAIYIGAKRVLIAETPVVWFETRTLAKLLEMRAAVLLELTRECGLEVTPVQTTTCRSRLLFGEAPDPWLPPEEFEHWYLMRCPLAFRLSTAAECCAFSLLNLGFAELGAAHMKHLGTRMGATLQ